MQAGYGGRFQYGDYRLATALPSLGTWLVHMRARSVVTGTTFTRTRTVTAQADPRVAIDVRHTAA